MVDAPIEELPERAMRPTSVPNTKVSPTLKGPTRRALSSKQASWRGTYHNSLRRQSVSYTGEKRSEQITRHTEKAGLQRSLSGPPTISTHAGVQSTPSRFFGSYDPTARRTNQIWRSGASAHHSK